MGCTACTEPQCLYNGALYLYLLVPWSRKSRAIPLLPYGPYGLYRASVPVQRCTLHLPVTLLPLRTVRPVQSLSACTTVHFTFTYTSNPLWAVRPVQSLSACTTVHFIFTFQCRGQERVELYLYSPYGLYGLYRASMSVQGCTLPLPLR